jgi:hypothetical protein
VLRHRQFVNSKANAFVTMVAENQLMAQALADDESVGAPQY